MQQWKDITFWEKLTPSMTWKNIEITTLNFNKKYL